MSINNPALYDVAYSAIANSNAAWTNDAVPADYATMKAAATNIATEIDAIIPTIGSGPTLSELFLMKSIVKSTFSDRAAVDMPSSFYATIASVIVAQWIEFGTGLQDNYVPVPTPSAFVYYLDSITTSIPNYLQLTPSTTFNPTTQRTATATGTPSSTVQFSVGGNPVAWVTTVALGVPFIQQGEWSDDLYASVNQPVSTTNVMLSFYSRTTGGVETHLFDITSPRVTSSTPAEASIESTEITYPVDPSDFLVVKAFAVFSGTTVSTTATLYYQGTTNASHVHTPIEQSNPPT